MTALRGKSKLKVVWIVKEDYRAIQTNLVISRGISEGGWRERVTEEVAHYGQVSERAVVTMLIVSSVVTPSPVVSVAEKTLTLLSVPTVKV